MTNEEIDKVATAVVGKLLEPKNAERLAAAIVKKAKEQRPGGGGRLGPSGDAQEQTG